MTSPSFTPHEVVVVCNGTGGCSVPYIGAAQPIGMKILDNDIDILGDNGVGKTLQDNNVINSLSIIAKSPVLYIQRLKRWYQENMSHKMRTKRTERSVSAASRGNVRFNSSHLSEDKRKSTDDLSPKEGLRTSLDNKEVPTFQNKSRFNVQEPIFYPKRKFHRREKIKSKNTTDLIPLTKSEIESRSYDNQDKSIIISNVTKKPNVKGKVSQYPTKVSRWDSEDFDESKVDYIQTTRNDRDDSKHFSLFKNPVYDSEEDDDSEQAYNDEILLGGSNKDHDGTTPFPIVDVDHDYDGEYEYVKLENEGNQQSEEDEDGRNQHSENYDSSQNYPEEGNSEENHSEENTEKEQPNEDDEGNNQENPVVVVYKEDTGNVEPSFQFGLSPSENSDFLQARYISKDPLAGTGATRGFNHDFQVMRGVPIQGSVVVQPNNRFPTVPGFNTKQIHSIIKTGKLPGTPAAGPNGTTVGIIPIEPARHARPNNLGQYLGPQYPQPYGDGQYVRRPTNGVRARPQYYVGRGVKRPSYDVSPVRSQKVVLLNRNPRYRPTTTGERFLSHPVRGRNHVKLYRPRIRGRPPTLRVNLLEKRTSNEDRQTVGFPSDQRNYNVKVTDDDEGHRWENEEPDSTRQNDRTEYVEQKMYYEPNGEGTDKPHENVRTGGNQEHNRYYQPKQYEKDPENESPTNIHTSNQEDYRAHYEPKEYNEELQNQSPISRQRHNQDNVEGYYHTKDYDSEFESKPRVEANDEDEHRTEYQPNEYVAESQNKPPTNKHSDDQEEELENKSRKNTRTSNKGEHKQSYPAQENEAVLESGGLENFQKGTEKEHEHQFQTEEDGEESEDGKYTREGPEETYTDEQKEEEASDDSTDDRDLSKTLAYIVQRTKDMSNEKLNSEGKEPVSYNNYWTLEYSYPSYE